MMIRVVCPACDSAYRMPVGATVAEISAWMRWHADDHRVASPLVVHQHTRPLDVDVTDVDHAALRDAMMRSRDYDEGIRDAAAFVEGCLHTARNFHESLPRGPRRSGAEYLLARVEYAIRHERGRVAQLSFHAFVSADAETQRERADVLDVGTPDKHRTLRDEWDEGIRVADEHGDAILAQMLAESADESDVDDVEPEPCGICGATHEDCDCARSGVR